MKILVADDDPTSLLMMRRMLRQSGYEVVTASDGVAAVESVLDQDGPRLLLLDWMMPELSGPEVCQAIRRHPHQGYVYIVLLTAKDTKDELVQGLEAGADDYLTKPCHPEELRARLRTGQRVLQLEDGLVEARDEMHFRATHDALTSLLNRGAILEAMNARLCDARRKGRMVAVLLCDVDHFKAVNDTHGHPVGDEVLREVARRLQRAGASGDVVGRYGGEEFLIVFEEDQMNADTLARRAEAICAAVRGSRISTSAGLLPVSISAGAVIALPRELQTIDLVLQRVDRLLYQAKRAGRNRFVIGTDELLVA